MSAPSVGFIGFGEAAAAIAAGLKEAGIARLAAYDTALASPDRGPAMHARAAGIGVALAETPAALAAASDVVLSAVTASVAVAVATAIAPHLARRHIYVDLNSASPAVKHAVGDQVTPTGAGYVDCAVMAAVPPLRHKVPLLVCGPAAEAFAALMAPFGMRIEAIGPEIGQASAIKMFRSILMKGLEALILESLLASSQYGVERRVFDSVGESFPGLDWNQVANYLVGRTAIHGARRAKEMAEVAETLRAMGIDPIMSDAIKRRIAWAGEQNLKQVFGDTAPETYGPVIEILTKAARGT